MSQPTPADRPLDATGLAGVVLCCALWGGNAVAVKYSVPAIPAFGCAGLRFVLCLPILAAVCRSTGARAWPSLEAWPWLAINTAFTVVQIATFNWGTSRGQAGRSSVFINIHPLVVAPLAWVFLGERMGPRGVAGLLSAAGGVAVLLAEKLGQHGSLVGDLVVLGSGIVFGVQTIIQKRTFARIAPPTLLISQSALAVPAFFAISGLVEGFGRYRFTPSSVWAVVYQGLAVSGVGFTTWLLLLKRYPAGRLAAMAFLTPLFGVVLGNLWRGEPVTWPLLAGGALVGVGIYLVSSERISRPRDVDLTLPGEDAL